MLDRDEAIRRAVATGRTLRDVGREFGLTGARVGQIVSGRTRGGHWSSRAPADEAGSSLPNRGDLFNARLGDGTWSRDWVITKVTTKAVCFEKPGYAGRRAIPIRHWQKRRAEGSIVIRAAADRSC